MDSLLADSARTGIFQRQPHGSDSDRGHAYSGERISDAWWDRETGIDLPGAERSAATWLEYWASRVPIMLAAIERGKESVRGELEVVASASGSAVGTDWTDDEARAAIAAYFEMLDQTRLGVSFVKRRRLEALMAQTRGRSRQSCEFKLRNISAVMDEMGLAYLKGYVPADNFQQRLADLVAGYVDSHPDVRRTVKAIVEAVPSQIPAVVPQRSDIQEPPPVPSVPVMPGAKSKPKVRLVVDVAGRDAANRALGRSGEQFVVELERAELHRAGRSDLAERVRWVADLDGDGLGYDVLSFSPDGSELHIEVKTTNGPKTAPFFVTENEVRVSERLASSFRLYRLFEFASGPRMYVRAGKLRDAFQLDAVVWRACTKKVEQPFGLPQ